MGPDEFAQFYAASFRRLTGQVYAMTGNLAEAQDAVQEAFTRAWEHRGKLDSVGSPEAWVRTAAWHIAVSRWRRFRRGRELALLTLTPQVIAGPAPDRVAFLDALRRIPAEQRRVIVLYYLCDLTVSQIAAETGTPTGTVRSRLARGKAVLASYLDDSLPEELSAAAREVRGA